MVSVDITCDLMDEDETGYVWTLRRDARDAALIEPGAIVHLRVLPGVIEDYEALIRRAITSA